MPSFTVATTVDINAGKDAVWDVLTDFAHYQEWNPVMRIGKLGLRGIAAGEHFFVLTTNDDFSHALKDRVERLHGTSKA